MLATQTSTATFIRHYIEMVAVMFAGMIVLGLPGEAALKAIGSGTSALRDDAPSLVFLGMATTHDGADGRVDALPRAPLAADARDAASMIIPTLVAIALLAADVLDFGTLMGLEHVAMLLGMLVAMLLRLDEYTGHAHHGHDVVAA